MMPFLSSPFPRDYLHHSHSKDLGITHREVRAIKPGVFLLPSNAYVWTGMMTLTLTVCTPNVNMSILATDVHLTPESLTSITRQCFVLTKAKDFSVNLY